MKINLLPKDERPLKQSSIRPAFIVGLIGLLLLGTVLYGSWQQNVKANDLAREVEKAKIKEAQLQSEVKEVNAIRQELKDLEAKEAIYGTLATENEATLISVPILINDIFSELWIADLSWDSSMVVLNGYTQNMTSISKYLNYLNERSEETRLNYAQSIPGTDFIVFEVEVEGVGSYGTASLH